MSSQLPQEDAIRKYLLGVLREPELSEVEEKLLSSTEFSETAEMIEDEIIEQYLDGALDERDSRAVKTHFLRPPAHRQKLRFARMLRHRLEDQDTVLPDVKNGSKVRPPQPHRFLWSYGTAITAALLAVTSLTLGVIDVSLKNSLEGIKKQEKLLQAQLDQARSAVSPLVSLELRPGLTRGSGSAIPKATAQMTTLVIRIDLVLPSAASGSFRARLVNDKGEEIWSLAGLEPIPSPPKSRLVFDIPVQGIGPGAYSLVVSLEQNPASAISYPFDIELQSSGDFQQH